VAEYFIIRLEALKGKITVYTLCIFCCPLFQEITTVDKYGTIKIRFKYHRLNNSEIYQCDDDGKLLRAECLYRFY
jgi:hypothetical protein